MVPRAGDIVDINPLFKTAHDKWISRDKGVCFGDDEDGHIHVVDVEKGVKGIRVSLVRGSYLIDDRGYPIEFSQLARYGFPFGAPLFVPIRQSIQSIQKDRCPLCGSCGTDLAFEFYCSNPGCKNYHP